jgi:hypothetical protein
MGPLIKSFDVASMDLSNLGLPTTWRGGVALFNTIDSHRLIDLCEDMKIGILGIEGFILDNEKIIPVMDLIADFSVLLVEDFPILSTNAARKFLSISDKNNVLYEFSLAKMGD